MKDSEPEIKNIDRVKNNDLSEEEKETTRRIINDQKPVDYPIITRCFIGSHGLPSFTEGSPYLHQGNIDIFVRALREKFSLMKVEPARKIFRTIGRDEKYPVPENCTPYVDANALGFYLKNVLPLVFVKTRKGEILLEARVALKYIRENSSKFSSLLSKIKEEAQLIFKPEIVKKYLQSEKYLFTDVIQPYSSFALSHLSMRAGLWIHTPPGVNTVIGPLINQPSPLSIVTGSIETDWHHFELFVVAEVPRFDGEILLIEAGTPIAQLFFVDRRHHDKAQIRFSHSDPSSNPQYGEAWNNLGIKLSHKGRTIERSGIASIQIGCPHCYVSITNVAENGVPDNHVLTRGFNPAYKVLKHEYHSKTGGPKIEGEGSDEKE